MSVPNVRMLTTYLSGVTRHTCYVHKFLYLHRVKSNTLSTGESETSSKRLHSVYVVSRPLPVVFFFCSSIWLQHVRVQQGSPLKAHVSVVACGNAGLATLKIRIPHCQYQYVVLGDRPHASHPLGAELISTLDRRANDSAHQWRILSRCL